MTDAAQVDADVEGRLLVAAAAQPLARLREIARAVKAAADPDRERTDRRIHDQRWLRRWTDAEGAYDLGLRTPPVRGTHRRGAPAVDRRAVGRRPPGRTAGPGRGLRRRRARGRPHPPPPPPAGPPAKPRTGHRARPRAGPRAGPLVLAPPRVRATPTRRIVGTRPRPPATRRRRERGAGRAPSPQWRERRRWREAPDGRAPAGVDPPGGRHASCGGDRGADVPAGGGSCGQGRPRRHRHGHGAPRPPGRSPGYRRAHGGEATHRSHVDDLAWLCKAHHDDKTYHDARLTGPPGNREWHPPERHSNGTSQRTGRPTAQPP